MVYKIAERVRGTRSNIHQECMADRNSLLSYRTSKSQITPGDCTSQPGRRYQQMETLAW